MTGAFTIAEYCLCGATLKASGAGQDRAIPSKLRSAFWSWHDGPGHGPATPAQASQARMRQERPS